MPLYFKYLHKIYSWWKFPRGKSGMKARGSNSPNTMRGINNRTCTTNEKLNSSQPAVALVTIAAASSLSDS